MKRIYSFERVQEVFDALNANPYSALWDLIDDFEYNGHIIRIKDSHQLRQVIIDGVYEHIGGNITIEAKHVTYKPMEYVRLLLES